jgi:hypothetical protein
MMAKTFRTRQITIETHSVTIIRTKGKSFSAYCKHCRIIVSVFTIEQIAEFFQKSVSDICQEIESNRLHLIKPDGLALVCGNSLENK